MKREYAGVNDNMTDEYIWTIYKVQLKTQVWVLPGRRAHIVETSRSPLLIRLIRVREIRRAIITFITAKWENRHVNISNMLDNSRKLSFGHSRQYGESKRKMWEYDAYDVDVVLEGRNQAAISETNCRAQRSGVARRGYKVL